MKEALLFPIKLVLGLVLYATSKDFRKLVQGKLHRGQDDTVSNGEEVIVVLRSVDDTGEMSR